MTGKRKNESVEMALVRAARETDLPYYLEGVGEILALQGNTFTPENVIQEEETFARLRSEGRCVIAENEGKPDGFVLWETGSVRPCLPLGQKTDPYVWVNVVFVSGHTRGRGVGRLLYEHLEASVRAEGFRRVTLVIYAVNAASLQFHQRLGYAIETTIDWKRLPPRPVLPRKSQEKRFSVGLAQPGMLVAARADGTEVGHVLFEDTQESPYGISYGKYDYPFLHVHELVVKRELVDGEEERSAVAIELLAAVEEQARPGVEHMMLVREKHHEEEARWSERAGLKHQAYILGKTLT